MQICKNCYIKMTGVSSFSDGQMERYYKCQKCKYETKHRKLRKEELSRLFDKIVVFDKNEITKEEKDLYNLNDMMYNELYENGGLAFHLKFMYPQTITNRRL